jgi:hypothetical protein
MGAVDSSSTIKPGSLTSSSIRCQTPSTIMPSTRAYNNGSGMPVTRCVTSRICVAWAISAGVGCYGNAVGVKGA